MKTLHLHVTFEYYDDIVSGRKPEEYRDYEKWKDKIEGKDFDSVTIWRAYTSERVEFPWRGYEIRTITHKHFKNIPKKVFAIRLEKP